MFTLKKQIALEEKKVIDIKCVYTIDLIFCYLKTLF